MGDLFQAWVGFRSFETPDVARRGRRPARAPPAGGRGSSTSRGTATSSSPAAPTPTPSTASPWRPRSRWRASATSRSTATGSTTRTGSTASGAGCPRARRSASRCARMPRRARPPDGPLDRAAALADQLQAPRRAAGGGHPRLRRAAAGRRARRAAARPFPRAAGLDRSQGGEVRLLDAWFRSREVEWSSLGRATLPTHVSARHHARQRHLHRRAGDRLPLRGLHSDDPRNQRWRPGLSWSCGGRGRPGRHADRPAGSRRCASACRGSTRCSSPTPTPTTSSGSTTCGSSTSASRRRSPATARRRPCRRIRRTFAYVFEAGQEGGGKPQLDLIEVREPFELLGATVRPGPGLARRAWRSSATASAASPTSPTAASSPRPASRMLEGVEILILDALRYRPHSTHFSLEEAMAAAARIGARAHHPHPPRARRRSRRSGRPLPPEWSSAMTDSSSTSTEPPWPSPCRPARRPRAAARPVVARA